MLLRLLQSSSISPSEIDGQRSQGGVAPSGAIYLNSLCKKGGAATEQGGVKWSRVKMGKKVVQPHPPVVGCLKLRLESGVLN